MTINPQPTGTPTMDYTPPREKAYFRSHDIIGDKAKGIHPMIPISRTGFMNRVADGTFPKPRKFGRLSLWSLADIKQMLATVESK